MARAFTQYITVALTNTYVTKYDQNNLNEFRECIRHELMSFVSERHDGFCVVYVHI